MNENPYSATATSLSDATQRSLACTVMMYLSITLCLLGLIITSFLGYQNIQFLIENELWLPPYVIAANLLVFCCAILMGYSAWLWKSGKVRGGIGISLGSVILFFIGPSILLRLLAF